MSRERLELVTDFATLRVGMLVVTRGCGECGGEHRGMLAAFGDEPGFGPHFIKLPRPGCRPHWIADTAINTETVALKMVFKVADGLEASDSQPAATVKPRQLERERP